MTELRNLPTLQFAQRPIPAPDIGDKGELKWLRLSDLRVDPTYQREILETGKANIRRMIEGFSWLLFGVVIVASRPNGKYAIIDGQHRVTAALLHGNIAEVPCLVLSGGGAAEARAFSAINGNVTRIHVLQSFRAKVAGGDVYAVALVRMCARAGVTIAPYPKTELQPGETLALGSLRSCLKKHGEKPLVAGLKILRALDETSGLSAPAIMGTCEALIGKPEWISGGVDLATKIAAPGKLASLCEKARTRRATRGGTEWINFTAVINEALSMASRVGSLNMKRLMGGR